MNRIRTVLIALAFLPTCLVVPARAENVVRWAAPLPTDSFDPYGHDELFTFWVQNLVFESLINYDWRGRLEPGLAVSWKRLDPLTWEMELRNGSPSMTAPPSPAPTWSSVSSARKPRPRRGGPP